VDQERFDRIAAALGGAATRRAGLKSALAVLAGLAAGTASGETEAKGWQRGDGDRGKDRGRGGRKHGGGAKVEGPCGDGTRKDNVCTKDSQCCTGYCDTSKGKKNKDGQGRCRCIRRGKSCTSKQTCCGKLTCDGGVCGAGGVPTGATCVSGETCASPDAVCTAYTDAEAPSGTFCTMPLGTVCTGDPDCTCYHCGPVDPAPGMARAASGNADLACCHRQGLTCQKPQHCCTGWLCESGTCCSATGTACASDGECCSGLACMNGTCAPCVETVCASDCDFTDVNAAYAAAQPGDTIYIGAGTYATGIKITKDITLTACPGVTGVKLQPDRVMQDPDQSYYVVITEDSADTSTPRTVTVRSLELEGTSTGYSNQDEALLWSGTNGTVTFTIDACILSKAYYGVSAGAGAHQITDSTFKLVSYYGAQFSDVGSSKTFALTIDGSTFEDSDSYGAYFGGSFGTVAVSNSTFQRNVGGAIYVAGSDPQTPVFTFTNLTIDDNEGSISIVDAACTFTDCAITNTDAAGISVNDGNLTLDNTTISNNTTVYNGGGIYALANNDNFTITLSGTTQITSNTAAAGAGIWLGTTGGTITVVGGGTRISNNTPANTQCYKNGSAVSCDTWT
jgi:hypothetical protein